MNSRSSESTKSGGSGAQESPAGTTQAGSSSAGRGTNSQASGSGGARAPDSPERSGQLRGDKGVFIPADVRLPSQQSQQRTSQRPRVESTDSLATEVRYGSRRTRWHSRLVGFLGILVTTSAWVIIEKIMDKIDDEWNHAFPDMKIHHWQLYSGLALLNVALILCYEKWTKTDLFKKLGDLV